MSRFRGNWETGQRRSLRRVLVVGAGRAGVAAAEELRRQGYGGEILVMCDEADAPYDRPSCSKGLLTGHKRPVDARMPVQDDLAIQWLIGRRAAHLDSHRRVVTADTDEEFSYDGLVIATGARPVWPKDWPPKGDGLYTLHGLQDAWALRKALRGARRAVVVGGGLTGCEVACSIRSMARECVLVDSKQHVMVRALGEVVGGYVTEEVGRDGVDLRLGRRVRGVERHRRGWVVVLDDGSAIETDVVVATIGERPDTKWLADSGFDVSDGVLCDENLRVVGGEDVVACGTVARWPNLRYSAEPRRVGQWIMALEQGRAAASALLRSDHPSRPAALVPRYWSEQFGLRIQVCGEVTADHDTEVTVERRRGGRHTARNGVLVGYHKQGEQTGVVAVNMMKAFTTVARQILAAPPRLAAPPELSPPAPPRRAAESRMLAAAPASAPAGGRHTIDVPASAVRDVSDEPYPPAAQPRYAPQPGPQQPGQRYPEPAYAAAGARGHHRPAALPAAAEPPPPGYPGPYGMPPGQPGHPPAGPPSTGHPHSGYPGYPHSAYPAGGYPPAAYPPGQSPPDGSSPGYPYPPSDHRWPTAAYPGYHLPPAYQDQAAYQEGPYQGPGAYQGPAGYGPPRPDTPVGPPPAYDHPQQVYDRTYGVGHEPRDRPTGGPAGYGSPAEEPDRPPWQAYPDSPVSPAVRPVSPATRRPAGPRDRFTSEFAAIR